MSPVISKTINTDLPVIALERQLNFDEQVQFAGDMLKAVEDAHLTLESNVNNEFIAVREILERVAVAADKIEQYEKDQLKEILERLVNDATVRLLMAALGVTLSGSDYQLASSIEAFAYASNIDSLGWEILKHPETGMLTGAKLTLVDGRTALFTFQGSQVGNDYTGTFDCVDFAGVPAFFSARLLRREKSFASFKTTLRMVRYEIVSAINILVDLTGRLRAMAPVSINVDAAVNPPSAPAPAPTPDPVPADPVVTEEPAAPADPVVTEEPATPADPVVTEEPAAPADPVVTEEPATPADPAPTEEPIVTQLPL
ncbi:hypothetical protein [Sphaerotilus sp.]|uniref:hypothetical protein n=1 Tax=Sphaerotilus sp. TaxID=2093942 RepID=UPI00286D7766|nr:hypothetical protein [Sphaerotilus sp.]